MVRLFVIGAASTLAALAYANAVRGGDATVHGGVIDLHVSGTVLIEDVVPAKLGDFATCHASTSDGRPHGGGIIIGPGVDSVLIEGSPAIVIGAVIEHPQAGNDVASSGSDTVWIGGGPLNVPDTPPP